MGKYELQCRISELERRIQECYDKIYSNNNKIANLEQAHNVIRQERQHAEAHLYERHSSFLSLNQFKSQRIRSLSSNLQAACSGQSIVAVLSNYDDICNAIIRKINELQQDNRFLQTEISRCENEINSCRSQIAAIEREERERAEQERREREQQEREGNSRK